jgi:hypothetical protein
VRFFSGTARYRKTFDVSDEWHERHRKPSIHLGRLWTIGQVWLNGEDLGIVWTPPFRVDCTGRLKPGRNELVVDVTNTWYNRLAGDARLPADERITRTNITTSGGRPWSELDPIESGLFGPVLIGSR